MREVHSGVWLSGDAPLTDWQRWKAATLTCEGTVLAGWSGATFVGLRKTDRWPTTVKRVGQGGPRLYAMREGRLGSLLVTFAKDLAADTVEVDEIPVLAPSRIVLGLVSEVSEQAARRFVRDALRLEIATPAEMQLMLARHPGARSISDYRRYVHEYGELGLDRGKSDAEALAIALFAVASIPRPAWNVMIAGGEADFAWWDRRLILEADGPQYHRFLTDDARKQARWEQAGWVVRRLPTGDIYDAPHRLLAAATDEVTEEERAIAAATRSPDDVLVRLRAARAKLSVL